MSLLLLSTTMYTQTGRPTCLFAVECISTRIAIVRARSSGRWKKWKKQRGGENIEAWTHEASVRSKERGASAATSRDKQQGVVDGNAGRGDTSRGGGHVRVTRESCVERSLPRHTITGPLCDRTYSLLLGSAYTERDIYRMLHNRNDDLPNEY